jgi:CheY-like chemotaxis protein/anti-sigma regulatory factor (Ser/Thr protein kinase)
LLTLINDILELSKIESGKMEVCAEEVDPAELLRQVVDMMRLRAEQAGIALNLALEGLPGSVVLDPVMLRQVLLNLLSNAVKFTPAGQVSLLVSGVDAGREQSRLTFSVSDTGIGIGVEDLTRIFQPFEQAGGSHWGGTGLGLTISQQYVRMMGGELTVESSVGKGSTFSFSITVAAGKSSGIGTDRGYVTGVEPRDHGCRILVVDDIPEARLLVRSLLEPLGFAVSEASSGAEAEAVVDAGQADLVFMDWFMPDTNGLLTIQRIRARTDIRQPRIVMLTANALQESRQAALAAGADDFLSKPYEENALFAVLEKHLAVHFTTSPTQEVSCPAVPERGISADDLAGLTAATRARLSTAALSLNQEQIAEALLAVAHENPELAARLGEFSNTRQYQALWQVLGILDGEE